MIAMSYSSPSPLLSFFSIIYTMTIACYAMSLPICAIVVLQYRQASLTSVDAQRPFTLYASLEAIPGESLIVDITLADSASTLATLEIKNTVFLVARKAFLAMARI